MMSGPSADAIRAANGLAYVCGHLEQLRKLLNDDGADPSTPLGQLLNALQSGEAEPDLSALLDSVDTAARQAGDAFGVYGFLTTRRGGVSGMETLQIVFRCPLRRCAGRGASQVRGSTPVCAISPQRLPLDRERL
jgi:hypothetical protein